MALWFEFVKKITSRRCCVKVNLTWLRDGIQSWTVSPLVRETEKHINSQKPIFLSFIHGEPWRSNGAWTKVSSGSLVSWLMPSKISLLLCCCTAFSRKHNDIFMISGRLCLLLASLESKKASYARVTAILSNSWASNVILMHVAR